MPGGAAAFLYPPHLPHVPVSTPDPNLPSAPTDFAKLAEEYCRLIDEREQYTGDQLLTRAHGLLPRLYAAVLDLPAVGVESLYDDEEEDAAGADEEADEEEDDDEPYDIEAALAARQKDRTTQEQWWEIFRSLSRMFGDKDAYIEIFEPYGPDPSEELVTGTLGDDLVDIYANLADGLAKWRRGEHQDAADEWRTSFVLHWGEHVTGALRALYALAWDHKLPFPGSAAPHRADG